MNKMQKMLKAHAAEKGWQFDEELFVAFGTKDGYSFCVQQQPDIVAFQVIVTVTNGTSGPSKNEINEFTKPNKKLIQMAVVNGYQVTFNIVRKSNQQKMLENLDHAMELIITELRQRGYGNCCKSCGVAQPTEAYYISGVTSHLCGNCQAEKAQSNEIMEVQQKTKRENILLGVVGALIGAVIGAASIVLIGQLGYVSMLSGFIMGLCTLKGYELLGGKLTTKGIVISIVLMIVMTYLGECADWAMFIARETSNNFFDCFSHLNKMLHRYDVQTEFTVELVKVYMFCAIGAAATVVGQVKNNKIKFVTKKLGM